MPTNTPWTTNYPTSQDTGTNGEDQQPDLQNDSSPGALDGDRLLVSHPNTLRNKLHALALVVGDDSDLPAGSLKARVTALEGSGGGGLDREQTFTASTSGSETFTLSTAMTANPNMPSGYSVLVFVNGVKHKWVASEVPPSTREFSVMSSTTVAVGGLSISDEVEIVYAGAA